MNFYQHFIKYLTQPYGLPYSTESLAGTILPNCLKTINCEFMLRLHVGFLEFSATDPESIKIFLTMFESILKYLQVVNQKNKSGTWKRYLNSDLLLLSSCNNIILSLKRHIYICYISISIYIYTHIYIYVIYIIEVNNIYM